jgi:hypothetical protein
MKRTRLALICLMALSLATFLYSDDTLNTHPVKLDVNGKLLSWVEPQDMAYDRVMRLAWDFLLDSVPVESNGLKTYFTYCCMDTLGQHTEDWPHDPAMVYGAFADSAVAYYAYSGDRSVVKLVEALLDYDLVHGRTPADWNWASVPYASSDAGAQDYSGADDVHYNKYCGQISIPGYTPPKIDWKGKGCGTGDGRYVIEPDKVGELGMGYLRSYELTGKVSYRDAALACADALAHHVRVGDALHSPWPFRVYAKTDVAREEYSSNVIGPIRLFDELTRLKLGNVADFRRARGMAWEWMMRYPLKNDRWAGYFEDVQIFPEPVNFNQYSPLETARYILQHPEYDPNWRDDVPHLIRVVEEKLVVNAPKEPARQWGADAVSEQFEDMNKMGSHTSRYGSVNALWYEITGDTAAKERAFRSLNWATYMCRSNGVVNVGPVDQSIWWADGYADYIRHLMAALGSVPEWAPLGQDHLLRTTSIVRSISYQPKEISYSVFDDASTEILRLSFTPASVLANGKMLPKRIERTGAGWTFDERTHVLILHHDGANEINISAR